MESAAAKKMHDQSNTSRRTHNESTSSKGGHDLILPGRLDVLCGFNGKTSHAVR